MAGDDELVPSYRRVSRRPSFLAFEELGDDRMRHVEPDFSSYTDDELHDIAGHLDRHTYPDRWDRLLAEFERRRHGGPPIPMPLAQITAEGRAPGPLTIRESLQKQKSGLYLLVGLGFAGFVFGFPLLMSGPHPSPILIFIIISVGFVVSLCIQVYAFRCPHCRNSLWPLIQGGQMFGNSHSYRFCPSCAADLDAPLVGKPPVDAGDDLA